MPTKEKPTKDKKATGQKKLTAGAIAIFAVLMVERQTLARWELEEILGSTSLSDAIGWLKQEKLVDVGSTRHPVTKRPRETYVINKAGWSRAREIMTARPATTGLAAPALFAVLAGVNRALEANGLQPDSFFRPSDAEESSTSETASAMPDSTSVQDLVRKAYRTLSTRPGEWVRLVDIHDQLRGQDRTEIDNALKSLAMQPGVQLIPWDNRNALDARDHEMALRFGGEENHAIRIEEA
ncbi:hypothetical protein [Allorhizocola rhizosphaerae]|uniref:hypothetical protein n=1 Tax=Allorhizocola rhizosphaerae TaxID=1872709 RepID=UPI000E3E7110|nr:hypothetical protein [Allorhizocola rhizosphaerae]